MKRFSISLCLLLGLCSCSVETITAPEDATTLIDLIIYSIESKTCLDADRSVKWEKGDAISVLDAAGNHRFYTSDEGASATFHGKALQNRESTYVLYPYDKHATLSGNIIRVFVPAEQQGRKNSFGKACNVSVARLQGNSFYMRNTCGLFKLSISREDVVSVDIISNDKQVILSGTADATISDTDAPTMKIVKGSCSVSLNANGELIEPGTYYLDVMPASMETGYTLRVYLSDGRISEVSIDGSVIVDVSKIVNLGVVDSQISVNQEQLKLGFYDVKTSSLVQPFDEQIPSSAVTTENIYKYSYLNGKLEFKMKSDGGGFYEADNDKYKGLVFNAGANSAWIKLPVINGKALVAVGISNGTTTIETKNFKIVKSLSSSDINNPIANLQCYGSTVPTVTSTCFNGQANTSYFLYASSKWSVVQSIVLTYADAESLSGPYWIKSYAPSRDETTWTMINETHTINDIPGFCPVGSPKVDRYGGWECDISFTPTGYFYCKFSHGRWWMVDPLGNPFVSAGVCCFKRYTKNARFKSAYDKLYGGNAELWAKQEWNVLNSYGFNSLGAFCDEAVIKNNLLVPYSLTLTPMDDYLATVKDSYIAKYGADCWTDEGPFNFPLFFDEGFTEMCKSVFAKSSTTYADDPYLMGIFTDNELPVNTTFLETCLNWPDKSHVNYSTAIKWLSDNGVTQSTALESLDWKRKFAAFCYETYLKKVSSAKKLYFPHNMYWGTKATGANYVTCLLNDYTFQVAGPYVDAYSIDWYASWSPESETLQKWHEYTNKPFILAEWYVKGADVQGAEYTNTDGVGWVVPTQRDRGLFYQNYVLECLKSGVVVGWHWFKYCDGHPDPATPSAPGFYSQDNSNKGLLTIDMEPYTECLDVMRELNSQIYPLCRHFKIPFPNEYISGGKNEIFTEQETNEVVL